jgi:cytochrome c-type biogenesis protein CcmH/NrfG
MIRFLLMQRFFFRLMNPLFIFYIIASIHVYAENVSLSELKLSKIIELQQSFFKNSTTLPKEELLRQAQYLVNQYESYLNENPKDVNGLILFGKFLKKTGHPEDAFSKFWQADLLNPNIAVTKQQIGNFFVEHGRVIEAFPFFIHATRLEPNEPSYHFDLGNFIYIFEEQLSSVDHDENLGKLMHQSFKHAAYLKPEDLDYQLRFAQSFFDFNHSNLNDGLVAWEKLLAYFSDRTKEETDYIKLGIAKMLIKLNKPDDALNLLSSIQTKSLLHSKGVLTQKIRLLRNK